MFANLNGDTIDQIAFLGLSGVILGVIAQDKIKMVKKYIKKPAYAAGGGAVIVAAAPWAYKWAMSKKGAPTA